MKHRRLGPWRASFDSCTNAAFRPGDDQAAGGSGGSPALDLLLHVPGDGDHGVSVKWGDARTRAADRRARLPEDDEALRPDGGHDHRRRDRAHRDLGVGCPARRRAPRDVRAASRDGRATRGRIRHVSVRLARTLDQGVRLCRFPPGGGGARPRVEGAPRPPGSVLSGRPPGASGKTDPCSGGPRVRVPCSRVLIACTGVTPGCGGRSDRARGSGTQAHPVARRGRERDRHVRRRDPAPHRISDR